MAAYKMIRGLGLGSRQSYPRVVDYFFYFRLPHAALFHNLILVAGARWRQHVDHLAQDPHRPEQEHQDDAGRLPSAAGQTPGSILRLTILYCRCLL